MTDWLVHTFVRNHEETHRMDVRFSYSLLSGIVGILCNLVLFGVKLAAGLLSGSAAVLSDAVNNLTDCISCVLSLIGNRIAARPADSEHPFGHGRMEYIVSLAAAALIFTAAYELFLNGVREIVHPSGLHFTPAMGVILLTTIGVKFWMSRFNKTLGERLDHSGMKAASADSMNDVLATTATLVSVMLAQAVPGIPFDGITGALVALYIFYGGVQLIREIVGKLLGDSSDDEVRVQIESILMNHAGILGVHDVVVHDYGAGNRMGTAHAEVDAAISLRDAHEIIDDCEYQVEKELHIRLTIHPDPKETDIRTSERKDITEKLLADIVPGASLHDFRIDEKEGSELFRFDAALPYECTQSSEEILNRLEQELSKAGLNVRCSVTFDRGFFSERVG